MLLPSRLKQHWLASEPHLVANFLQSPDVRGTTDCCFSFYPARLTVHQECLKTPLCWNVLDCLCRFEGLSYCRDLRKLSVFWCQIRNIYIYIYIYSHIPQTHRGPFCEPYKKDHSALGSVFGSPVYGHLHTGNYVGLVPFQDCRDGSLQRIDLSYCQNS